MWISAPFPIAIPLTELPDSIGGALAYYERHFHLPALIVEAQNNRADLQAALKGNEVSQNNLQLAKANRAIDLGHVLTKWIIRVNIKTKIIWVVITLLLC